MPQTPHVERHFTGGETVRDVVIGMSDGLTVPFALAAGLSGAVGSAHVVVVAGLAEIAAGSIAMGLGGFLAARSDAEHYEQELAREKKEIGTIPEAEASEVSEVFESYGLSKEESQPIVAALRQRPEAWVNFMMRFELGLEEPRRGRALGFRWVNRAPDGGEGHSFAGIYREIRPPERLVFTSLSNPEQGATLVFTEERKKTKLTMTIECASKKDRDAMLGMRVDAGTARTLENLAAYLPSIRVRQVLR